MKNIKYEKHKIKDTKKIFKISKWRVENLKYIPLHIRPQVKKEYYL